MQAKQMVIIRMSFHDMLGRDNCDIEFIRPYKLLTPPYYWQRVVIRYSRIMFSKHRLYLGKASVTFTF